MTLFTRFAIKCKLTHKWLFVHTFTKEQFLIPVKHGLLRFAPAILQGMRNPLIYSLRS